MIAILLGLFLGSFFGYVVHWVLHQSWSGPFYRHHQTHHEVLYPASSFLSSSYRSAGKDSSIFLFSIAFLPIILISIGLFLIGSISFLSLVLFIGTLVVWGLINNYLHDQFHISGAMWEKLDLFMKWRGFHQIHHIDTSKNLGIFVFFWDKLFRTFKEKN